MCREGDKAEVECTEICLLSAAHGGFRVAA